MNKYLASAELCKKLKDLGVVRDSEFYWVKLWNDDDNIIYTRDPKAYISNYHEVWNAYLTDELLEMMPDHLYNGDKQITYYLHLIKHEDYFICDYGYTGESQRDSIPSNALVKCLIYLLENDIITINDLRMGE